MVALAIVKELSVRLLDDLVLIRPDNPKGMSDGGLLLPHGSQLPPSEGVVLAVGPGRMDHGARVPPSVKPGDRVAFGPGSGVEVPVQGQLLRLMHEGFICWVYL